MKITTNKKELLKLMSIFLAQVDPETFEKEFPELWDLIQKTPDQELEPIRDEILKEAKQQVTKDSLLPVHREDLVSLYCHTSAVLGQEEVSKRFSKIRLLILNTSDLEDLSSMVSRIRIIEADLLDKHQRM